MNFGEFKVQAILDSKLIFIPKKWADSMRIKKGDKMVWILNEKDHESLILRRANHGGR